ncbi:MAG TPA: CBS domain-containing protein, partial [Candidatus Altiarchaeales archaeon]|nr:CBS domain-containing protein [Candidatus Altiarchaeales archaeon]
TVFKPFREDAKTPKVADVMTKKVVTAELSASIEDVSGLLIENDIDQVPITKDGRPVGIVTSLDVTKAVAGKKKNLAQVMSTGLITSRPDENLDAVSRRLDKHGINSTPVVDDAGALVGIITLGDINRVYRRLVK